MSNQQGFRSLSTFKKELHRLKSLFATVPFYVPEGQTTLLVLLSGQVILNDNQSIEAPSLVVLSREEIDFSIQAEQDSKFLILTGQPLNEPIEGYGPFVMNSKAEIVEAVRDFNSGKFGSMHA